MRRIVLIVTTACLAVGGLASLAVPAGAQTGDLAAMCQARIDSNQAETKAENLATMERALAAAPADALPLITAVRDGFKKKGEKYFETKAGAQASAQLDEYFYDNCPGNEVPVTAIDYEFQDVPATLAAGTTKIQLTNDAPKEMHEMALFKLNAAGAAMEPEALLALPQKKAEKLVDFSSSVFAFAPPGQAGYGFANLTPGDYIYACFIPVGSKGKGKPHFTQGMYGTLTVS